MPDSPIIVTPVDLTNEVVPAATLSSGTAGEEFEALVVEHVEAYRLTGGVLVHPANKVLPDPHAETPKPDRAPLRQADLRTRTSMGGFFASFTGCATALGMESVALGWTAGIALAVTAFSSSYFAFKRDKVVEEFNASLQKPTVTVPADVGSAYRAYQSAPALLRKAHASEAVVGSVEDQSAYVDTLLVEAGRLHALDASATPEGLAVRDTMIRLAAHAQALVTMAQRQRALVNAATLTTPMLLAHQPSPQTFTDAAAIMGEETALVRDILAGPEDVRALGS